MELPQGVLHAAVEQELKQPMERIRVKEPYAAKVIDELEVALGETLLGATCSFIQERFRGRIDSYTIFWLALTIADDECWVIRLMDDGIVMFWSKIDGDDYRYMFTGSHGGFDDFLYLESCSRRGPFRVQRNRYVGYTARPLESRGWICYSEPSSRSMWLNTFLNIISPYRRRRETQSIESNWSALTIRPDVLHSLERAGYRGQNQWHGPVPYIDDIFWDELAAPLDDWDDEHRAWRAFLKATEPKKKDDDDDAMGSEPTSLIAGRKVVARGRTGIARGPTGIARGPSFFWW